MVTNIEETTLDIEESPMPVSKLELAILVGDGSRSMSQMESGSEKTKAEMAEFHVMGESADDQKSFFDMLRSSTRSHEFQIAIIAFDHHVRRVLEPTPVTRMDLLQNHGGSAAIGLALRKADAAAAKFLAEQEEEIPRYAVILLMTNGKEEGPQTADPGPNSVTVAEEIKAKTKCGCTDVLFVAEVCGDAAEEEVLKRVVTPSLYNDAPFLKRCSGWELREFFLE